MGRLFDSKQLRSDLSLTGSFTGSFVGDGTGIFSGSFSGVRADDIAQPFINITASNNISSSGTITANEFIGLPIGLLSSSAQIGSDISGSFVQPSASFSTRITANETVTSKTLISSSTQFINITEPFTGSFTGSFSGDGSGLINVFEGTAASQSISTRITANEEITSKSLISGSAQITGFGFVSQSGGIVDLPNTKIQYANVYSSLGDLPAANDYHGMFAHVHATGKGYYAHAGEWIELANISVTSSIDSNTLAISTLNSSGLLSSSAQIGSDISGSFVGPSGSFSSRITTLEDQSIYSGSFSGSFEGNGSGLTNIPATGIVGLNLSRISSGSATASISPNGGLFVNTNLTASNISASAIEAFKMNVTHFTASFITASTIETSGSNIFGDESSDTHTFIGDIIAENNISASGYISGSIFSGDGSGLINIPASGITGLNLSQISSGSVTASIAPDKGFRVNTNTEITGSLENTGNILLNGGTLSIKNQGAQSEARFYCEVNNAHYTALKAQPHALFSGNPITLLPAYDLDFAKPNFQANITASGTISASNDISAQNLNLFGGGLSIKNNGAQSYARFYCEVNNAHYTELKAQPHSLFSGNPVVLLPNYDLDFRKPKFEANITASGNISASGDIFFNPVNDTTGTSVLTINPDTGQIFRTGSYSAGGSGGGFPFSGSAVITGSLIVSQSIVDFTSASSVNLNLEQIPLVNPKVEYVNCGAITSSGTTVPLPNGLTFVSSSVYEYIEIFINGLRMRYEVDFAPRSTSTIKYFTTIPSGSEITYKSLKRP